MSDTTTITPIIRKLEELRARFETLEAQMSLPEVASDPQQMVRLSREHGQLRRIMEPYETYRRVMAGVAESQIILADPQSDPEFKALAEEDIAREQQRAAELMDTLQKALVTSEDAAIQSIIME